MAFSRYTRAPILNFGSQQGTSQAISTIRNAIAAGTIDRGTQIVLQGLERLDTLAGAHYGDAGYWWVIAAASNIGWGLQVPPGTILYLPSLDDIAKLVN